MSLRAIRGPRTGSAVGMALVGEAGADMVRSTRFNGFGEYVAGLVVIPFLRNQSRTDSSDMVTPSFTRASLMTLTFTPAIRSLIRTSRYFSSWSFFVGAFALFAAAMRAESFLASSGDALGKGLTIYRKYMVSIM